MFLTVDDRRAIRRDAQAEEAGAALRAICDAENVAVSKLYAAALSYVSECHAWREHADAIADSAVDKAVVAMRDALRDLSYAIREDLMDMESGVGRYGEEG